MPLDVMEQLAKKHHNPRGGRMSILLTGQKPAIRGTVQHR